MTGVLGWSMNRPEAEAASEAVRRSPRVCALLSERLPDGSLPWHAYAKWYGPHWVLVTLAELGYPPGDGDLIPLREQVLGWLLGKGHRDAVKMIAGRTRRCASQEGNALWALLNLGLADERCDELAASLRRWQWSDGGWNCDRRPEAVNSSFMETLIPLRGLALYARTTGCPSSAAAAHNASEVFLRRQLHLRQKDGAIIDPDFVRLHYPCYWHYDILFGLTVLSDAGMIDDERCRAALVLLESMRLPRGGWAAEGRYWRPLPPHSADRKRPSGVSLVEWGPTGRTLPNDWVTVGCLAVLRASMAASHNQPGLQ